MDQLYDTLLSSHVIYKQVLHYHAHYLHLNVCHVRSRVTVFPNKMGQYDYQAARLQFRTLVFLAKSDYNMWMDMHYATLLVTSKSIFPIPSPYVFSWPSWFCNLFIIGKHRFANYSQKNFHFTLDNTVDFIHRKKVFFLLFVPL